MEKVYKDKTYKLIEPDDINVMVCTECAFLFGEHGCVIGNNECEWEGNEFKYWKLKENSYHDFIVENGLGDDDLKNDITLPTDT